MPNPFYIGIINSEKSILDHGVRIINKLYKVRHGRSIHQTLKKSDDPVVKAIMDVLEKTIPNVADHYNHVGIPQDTNGMRYRRMISQTLEFLLWAYLEGMDKHPILMGKIIKMFNNKYIKTHRDSVEETIRYSEHAVVKSFYKAVEEIGDPQLTGIVCFLLAIYLNDTAYRDIGDFMIYRVNDVKDKLKDIPDIGSKYHDLGNKFIMSVVQQLPDILPYIEDKTPEDWYYNKWEVAKAKTQRLRKSGELKAWECCYEEMQLVPTYQEARRNDYKKRTGG